MSRIILTITYEIDPQSREHYLDLAKRIKDHYLVDLKTNYSVFEQKGKANHFMEMFVCASQEEFDKLEENQTEKTEELLAELQEYIKDGKMKYTTLIELV
ncbi:MAG: hypothetical protein ABSB78_11330 [Bacteroidota bacterium]